MLDWSVNFLISDSMSTNYFTSNRSKLWPWLAIIIALLVAIYLLRSQGRLWMCSCGYLLLWAGDVWSSDNSQHLLDPYSFTHLLHGVVFCGVLAWGFPRLSPDWRLWLAISIEALWEVFENSEFIIQRYRERRLRSAIKVILSLTRWAIF